MAKTKKNAKKKSPAKKAKHGKKETVRLWLMYPHRLVLRPVVYELGRKYPVITNVRQASVTEEIGLVSLELSGKLDDIHRAIRWLEKQGIKVEPVEINVIDG